MLDLLIRGGRVIDPINCLDVIRDVAIKDGRVVDVAETIELAARKTIEASGRIVMPGIIDMHTHMRTLLGHPHAQRMVALAGVCTTLDMAGPLDNILDSIPESGAGINIAILEAAREGYSLQSNRPLKVEREALIERTLARGGIGIKLMGGHFPMDLDICQAFIEECAATKAWVAWHVGNTQHGSNIEGLRDAVEVAGDHFLHVAHVNSYCRAQVSNELVEAEEAIALLKAHPNLFSESYLSPLNGTRLTIKEDRPLSAVTVTCLKKLGYTPNYAGMSAAIHDGKCGVLYDDGVIGKLLYGDAGVDYWEANDTVTSGSFAVNPAVSRFLLAQAKRDDGSFVVDSFSTDGGCYPRNVIVENGLLLTAFGALSLTDFVVKASLNGARALGLPNKGHLSVGADADVTIIDETARRATATIVGGNVVMEEGKLLGRGTTIICDERGEKALKAKGIRTIVKAPFEPNQATKRFVR